MMYIYVSHVTLSSLRFVTEFAVLFRVSLQVVVCNSRVMVDNGIIRHIATHLVFAVDKLNVISEIAWLMTYLAARSVLSHIRLSLVTQSTRCFIKRDPFLRAKAATAFSASYLSQFCLSVTRVDQSEIFTIGCLEDSSFMNRKAFP